MVTALPHTATNLGPYIAQEVNVWFRHATRDHSIRVAPLSLEAVMAYAANETHG